MFVKSRQKKGITLIEMIISVLILGLALGAMLGSFVIGRVSATKAKHRIEAANLARQGMEWIKDQSYAGLPRGIAAITPSYPYQISNNSVIIDVGEDVDGDGILVEIDGDELTGSRITQVKPIGTPEEYLEVTVTVAWADLSWGGTSNVSERLVTIISR